MREILFRAKTTDGEWVCGDLVQLSVEGKDLCGIKEHDLLRTPHLCDSKTVGQYIGLTDKIGSKIFEGDICRCYTIDTNEERLFTVGIGECADCDGESLFCAVWAEFCAQKVALAMDDVKLLRVEVIGNIHDNPELLEGTT